MLIQAHPQQVCRIAVDDPGIVFDVDAPDRYQALLDAWPAAPPAPDRFA